MERWRGMPSRVKFAWVLLWFTLVNTPLSMFWYAKEEPKVILALSWFAVTLTSWDVIQSTHARENTQGEGE